MSDLLVQFTGLVVLLIGLGLGYWRWVRSRPALTIQSKLLLILFVATLIGGVVGGLGWWFDDPRSFSWNLPPLASRMLAVAGWAFAFVSFYALQRPVPRRLCLTLWMLIAYFVPLVLAIPVFHLNRFDFSAPITYAFFILVAIITVLTLWNMFKQPVIAEPEAKDTTPASQYTRVWLLIVAVVMALWGVALFVTDAGPSPLIWVWPGDLLTSRLISVMLLAIAIGAVYGSGTHDTSKAMLWVLVIYGAGVTVANLWNALANKPVMFSYVIVFGLIAIISALLLVIDRRTQT
jgi:hypothetical protein